jgi:hypothetical protein
MADDFYEGDEPVADVIRAFDRAEERGKTRRPHSRRFTDIAAAIRWLQEPETVPFRLFSGIDSTAHWLNRHSLLPDRLLHPICDRFDLLLGTPRSQVEQDREWRRRNAARSTSKSL